MAAARTCWRRAAAGVLLVSSAAAAAHASAATGPRPIIGGEPSAGDPAVVALVSTLGLPFCTGTLVSPRLVLTAAHCVSLAPGQIYFGTDPSRDGVFVPVAAVVVHPEFEAATFHADLAVVALTRPATIAAIELDGGEAGLAGRTARFIGFGYTEPGSEQGELGFKRFGLAEIETEEPAWLHFGVVACNGDSGGPLLVDDGAERLVGVVSHGSSDCNDHGAAVRVASFAAWVQARIDELDPPHCGLDWRCAAACPEPEPDPDCEEDLDALD